MKQLRFYNSLGNQLQDFESIDQKSIRYYHCGPTPYDYAHIGNFRSFLFADTLIRALRFADYSVEAVINITDIEDKLIVKAKAELDLRKTSDTPGLPPEDSEVLLSDGSDADASVTALKSRLDFGGDSGDARILCKSSELSEDATDQELLDQVKQIARRYAEIFFDDLDKLNIKRSDFDHIVWATDHIAAMQTMILGLLDRKLAYPGIDGIYFDIKAYIGQGHKYGQLVELDLSKLMPSVIEDEYDKENVADFALWKFQVDNEPAWDFILGNGINLRGRPGWHIECSAMSTEYLGNYFDLHTGGEDLKFPHHENEIAQCQGRQAQYYLHNAMLMVEGQKMSKSLGNVLKLADLEDPIAFRHQVLSTHYRSIMDFSYSSHQASIQALQNMRTKYSKVLYANREQINSRTIDINSVLDQKTLEEFYRDFREAIYDDLATPRALASLSKLVKSESLDPSILEAMSWADQVLGLNLATEYQAFDLAEIKLIDQRNDARVKQDYQTSDRVKSSLLDQYRIDSVDLGQEVSLYYRLS